VRRPAVPESLWAPRLKQEPPRQPYTAHASGTSLLSAASRRLHREALHGYERKLAKGGELRRIKECAGLPQHVMEEAEALLKKYFDVVGSLPPEVAAVALL
jgi:hypothetical protein